MIITLISKPNNTDSQKKLPERQRGMDEAGVGSTLVGECQKQGGMEQKRT